MLNVVLCINDERGTYYQHALTTISSAISHASCKLSFHILHDQTLNANLEKFRQKVEGQGHSIIFHDLSGKDFSELSTIAGKWGKGTLYRLYIQEYVKEDRVLYLDCDIIVTMDLACLDLLDMDDYLIAVVREAGNVKRLREDVRHIKKLGLLNEQYFNAGVIYYNLTRLKEVAPDCEASMRDLVLTGFTYPDQDALNVYFARRPDEVLYLSSKYNEQLSYPSLENNIQDFSWYEDRILHFCNPKKPWEYYSHAALMYWKYYAMAFPEANVLMRILQTKQHKYNSLCRFILDSPKRRGLIRRWRDISERGMFYAVKKRLFPKAIG